MKKYTTHNLTYIKRLAACILLALTVFSLFAANICAQSEDLFSARYDEPAILPYKEEVAFSHQKQNGNLQSKRVSFHAPTMSIVTICYTNGQREDGALSHVTVSVYSDTAELICQKSAGEGVTLLQFIPVYTGTYNVVIESRSALEGEYKASVEISASTGYSQNNIDTYPHSKSYTPKNHKSSSVRELYPKTMYPNTEYVLSVFEIKHTASSIITYKLNSTDSSEIRAVLYTDEGDRYLPHQSHSAAGYAAGDAQELYYEKNAYLFVYSKGEFSLEANLVSCNEPNISTISTDYKGMLDVSDAVLLYDKEKFDAIIADFPFSDVKNRNAKFFRLDTSASSVISFLCERKEHAYFSLVSGTYGLSYGSLYPLRKYNEYCSEVEPTKLCYSAVISDGAPVYLAYTGTGESVYTELFCSPTHTTLTEFEQKYTQETTLPQIIVRNIYDDKDIFSILGVEQNASDVTKINGYMLESESMYRHYYEGTDVITPPAQKGKYKLYAIINSSTMTEDVGVDEKYFSFFVTEISVESKFSLPSMDDLLNAVSIKNPLAILLVVGFFILIVAGIVISVRGLIIKYSLPKDATDVPLTVTDHAKLPENKKEKIGQSKGKE